MSGYSRDQFSKYSTSQLLDYIEQQNDQLNRFETRFRDVVRAYRGVLKEKEALESTVQALSLATTGLGDEASEEVLEIQTRTSNECLTDTDNDDVKSDPSVKNEPVTAVKSDGSVKSDVGEGGDTSDSGAEGKHGESLGLLTPIKDHLSPSGPLGKQLRHQLTTLTVAMATLTEEKTRMESSFQKDKKAMLAQYESLSKVLNSEREATKKEASQLQQQLEKVRETLRCEQMSRQDEQETHGQMLRELQTLISSERDDNEALKLQLDGANKELSELRKQLSEDKVYEYEQRVQSMSVELEQVKAQLMMVEKHDPSPLIAQLQGEIAEIKIEHENSLSKEQEKARQQSQYEEQRVVSLETKLSSLSETVGGYDRLRENDLATIHKLKERIVLLDSENTALTREHVDRKEHNNTERTQLSTLQDSVARMKSLLKLATVKINEKAVLPTDIEELSVSEYTDILSSQPSGKEYQQELSQMKDEFERYKARAQSVLKSRGGGTGKDLESLNKELVAVKKSNTELHSQLAALKEQSEEDGEKHSLHLQRLRQDLRDMDDKHRRELTETETQYKNKLYEVQSHVQTTRSRTLKLIEEKDSEVQRLKTELLSLKGRGTVCSESPVTYRREKEHVSVGSVNDLLDGNDSATEGPSGGSGVTVIKSADSSTIVQELLDKNSPVSSVSNLLENRKLLHTVQEQKYRDNDIAMSRRRRLQVEEVNRDLQERQHKDLEQINFLKGEIRKIERDRSRETESMEYVKNIIMHYMCADSAGRDQMIGPIATILHFSPQEVSEVKKRISARRWLTPPPK